MMHHSGDGMCHSRMMFARIKTCRTDLVFCFAALCLACPQVDLSRFRAAPSARLSHLPFESDGGLFQPNAEWRRRGL